LDAEDIEQIARCVADRLREEIARVASSAAEHAASDPAARLVDAATVARMLGVERDWVYAHADALGAVRLGGPQGRLRFDLVAMAERLKMPSEPPVTSTPKPRRPGASGPVEPLLYRIESAAGRKVAGRRLGRPRPDTGRVGPDA
jgi:hypothetical protein